MTNRMFNDNMSEFCRDFQTSRRRECLKVAFPAHYYLPTRCHPCWFHHPFLLPCDLPASLSFSLSTSCITPPLRIFGRRAEGYPTRKLQGFLQTLNRISSNNNCPNPHCQWSHWWCFHCISAPAHFFSDPRLRAMLRHCKCITWRSPCSPGSQLTLPSRSFPTGGRSLRWARTVLKHDLKAACSHLFVLLAALSRNHGQVEQLQWPPFAATLSCSRLAPAPGALLGFHNHFLAMPCKIVLGLNTQAERTDHECANCLAGG